jgi:hypothetical protein
MCKWCLILGGKKRKVQKKKFKKKLITFICVCVCVCVCVFFFKSQMWGVFIFSSNICGMSSYFQVWKEKKKENVM